MNGFLVSGGSEISEVSVESINGYDRNHCTNRLRNCSSRTGEESSLRYGCNHNRQGETRTKAKGRAYTYHLHETHSLTRSAGKNCCRAEGSLGEGQKSSEGSLAGVISLSRLL